MLKPWVIVTCTGSRIQIQICIVCSSVFRCKVIPQKYWPVGYMHVSEEKLLAQNEIFAVDEQLYSNFHFIKGSFFSGTTNTVSDA